MLSLIAQKRIAVVALAVIGLFVAALLLRLTGVLPIDGLVDAVPLALMLMGVGLTLAEDWAKRHRWWVVGAFVIVGVIGFFGARIQTHRAERKLDYLVEKLSQPNPNVNEILNEIRKGKDNSLALPSPTPLGTSSPRKSALTVNRNNASGLSPVAKGTAMLRGGQATPVSTKAVTATSRIEVWPAGDSGITGRLYATNIVPGVSFDVVSENGADAGKFFWIIYP